MKDAARFAIGSVLVALVCLLPAGLHAEREMFSRGDVDDSGGINMSDPVQILRSLFATEGRRLLRCRDAGDVDDNGQIQLTDAVYLLNFLFAGGEPPPAPFPSCGTDPTRDGITCAALSRRCETELLNVVFEPVDNGEAFVFVIDRSGSMQAAGELQDAKREVTGRISTLSEDHEFAVIFFDGGVLRYPEDGIPVRATPEEKLAAAEWIDGIPGGVLACPEGGLSAALTSLEQSAAARKRIIFMSDSGEGCQGGVPLQMTRVSTLETIAARNTEGVIIHAVTLGIRLSLSDRMPFEVRQALDFFQALADDSGGILVCKIDWSF